MRKSHKEELFNATFRLFILHGYDGVSLGDIEKATGMSRGAIFHYADSKLDLFRQVVEQYVLDRQSIDTKIRVGKDPSLREFIDAYIDGVKRTMTELMMLMGEGVTFVECSRAYLSIIQQTAVLFPDLSERQQQSITREQQVWQQVISRAVERGEVQPDIDTELMAQTFIALFYGRAYRDSLTNGLDADLLKRQMLQLYEAIAYK
jgi:AcrR family transcriptional regulator